MWLQRRADDPSESRIPKPISVEPTGKWDGSDGKWSSFLINVGDYSDDRDQQGHGQNFRVLISTSVAVTQVPLKSWWCNDDDGDCAERRGLEIFEGQTVFGLNVTDDSEHPERWVDEGPSYLPLPKWWSNNMGPQVNVSSGFAVVGLGPSSNLPTAYGFREQRVMATTSKDLFIGALGLENTPVENNGNAKPAFIDIIKQLKHTPSESYGYTAGAYYRNQVLGSLVLGGYDKSRCAPGIEYQMAASGKDHTLQVRVGTIGYKPEDSNDFNLALSGFDAIIDSTLPYLWLPDDACDRFRDRFRLTYDEERNLYTINETDHIYNKNQGGKINFNLNSREEGETAQTTISFPYDAFALEGNYPLFNETTLYFPIRKSANRTYVLGRTFLQEAYIIVDYERGNYTVAPAVFSNPMPEPEIVAIYTKDFVPAPPKSGSKGISPGVIAGIVVGVVIVLSVMAVLAFIFWRRRRRAKEVNENAQEIDTTLAGEQFKHRRVSELESDPPYSPKGSICGYYDRDAKDINQIPTINEMESPPAELYSPLPEGMEGTPKSERSGYFTKFKRRGATRESSTGRSTPTSPGIENLAELPGDDVHFEVDGQRFEKVESANGPPKTKMPHNRDRSDVSIPSNMDEVISGSTPIPETHERASEDGAEKLHESPTEKRPSHTRGLSDMTTMSESTAVSEPTPEEEERWARERQIGEPRRPLSE